MVHLSPAQLDQYGPWSMSLSGGPVRHPAADRAAEAAHRPRRSVRPRQGPQLEEYEGHRLGGGDGEAGRREERRRPPLHLPLLRLQHDLPGGEVALPHLQLDPHRPLPAVQCRDPGPGVHHHQDDAAALPVSTHPLTPAGSIYPAAL